MKYARLGKFLSFIRNHIKMITALIIIGLLAVVLTFITYFTSWSEVNVDTHATASIDLGSPAFFSSIESITGSPMLPLGGEVKVLNNGAEFVPDLLNEIRNARKSITIANYIYKDGELLNPILDALTEKAKEGVEVRVFMDGKGSVGNPEDKIQALKDAGGKVDTFRPLWTIRTILRGNKRTHLRAIVIDGRIGYIGGIAFEDGWLGNADKPEEWRDMMFKVTGLPARNVQDMFNTMWRETNGEILAGDTFYPSFPSVSLPCTSMCFATLLHIPSPDLEKNLSQLLWVSASGAKDHIYMETPYLLPDDNMLKVLKEKAMSGMDVEVLVPGPYVDSRIVQAASRSYYTEMLTAGIKIYEYQPAHMHTKIFTADGDWSIIGSANLDNRSSTLNVEGVMGIEDKKLAADLEKEFMKDREQATEITMDSFQTNALTRFFGRISRLFAKQY
jgi:cardiolipin synthase